MSFDDVMRESKRFAPSAALPIFTEGYEPRVYWFRLRLDRGDSNASWALRFTYKVTRIDLYVPGKSGFDRTQAGFDVGASDRGVAPGLLPLPESALHGQTLYVRVAAVVDPRSIQLATLPTGVIFALQKRGFFDFFVGFYVAIGALMLLMFVRLSDRSFINFAIVMFLHACARAISMGVLWQMLPPISFLDRELIYDTFALGAQLALAVFTIAFLQLRERDSMSLRVVVAGLLAQFSVYITDFFPNATLAFDWTFVVSLAFYLSLFFAGVRAYRGGMRVARIYCVGVACAATGYVVNMNAGLMPRPDLWVYALDVGSALTALFIGMAVAENVQESRAERERLVTESRNLERLAHYDGLTGVLNRRAFDEGLKKAAIVAFATRKALGVLMLDIDFFKEYNDTLGHQAGDEALRLVAQACAACVRGHDVFARYGGEEFAAILPEADHADLVVIADRMRASVSGLNLSRGDGRSLTISVGCASVVPRSADGGEEIVRDADEALYLAKAGGRNRTELKIGAA